MRRDHVKRIAGPDFRIEKIAELAQGESVSVSHPGHEFLAVHIRNRALDNTSGRIEVVHDVQCRGLVQNSQNHHQAHDILGIIEIPDADILNLDHDRTESPERLGVEVYVIGARGQLRIFRPEEALKIAPLPENVPHIPVPAGIPAVLGTEAAYPAFNKGLVQLILKLGRPE